MDLYQEDSDGESKERERETVIINIEVVSCPLLVSSVTALILFLILTVLILNEAQAGGHSSNQLSKTQKVRCLQDITKIR